MRALFLAFAMVACGGEDQLTESRFEKIEGSVECAEGACSVEVVAPETCTAAIQLLTKNSVFFWRRVELKQGETLDLEAKSPVVQEAFTLADAPSALTYACY